MRVGVFYHDEFARNGYYILRERVRPGFEALKDLVASGQVRVYTPEINKTVQRLLQATHTVSLIAEVKYEGEYEISLLSAAGVVEAAERLQQDELDMAFCFVGAAGHHASRNKFWGFCFFNDVAMAVLRLQEMGVKKILIVDVDPHFGDGTRDLLGGDPDVTHVNFHSGMTDNENREWNNYDYGIGGATDEVFMNKLEAVLNQPFDFEFLILIFGHDSHNDDYGPFRLSQAAYPFLGSLMHRIAGGKPTLMVLSGGSQPEVAREAIPGLIKGFINSPG